MLNLGKITIFNTIYEVLYFCKHYRKTHNLIWCTKDWVKILSNDPWNRVPEIILSQSFNLYILSHLTYVIDTRKEILRDWSYRWRDSNYIVSFFTVTVNPWFTKHHILSLQLWNIIGICNLHPYFFICLDCWNGSKRVINANLFILFSIWTL